MNKAQSFGFDVLLVLTGVLIFGQLMYLYSFDFDSDLLLNRELENNQLLYLTLVYNNSLSLFDSYICNNNVESFSEFNNTILHMLDTYSGNREYYLQINEYLYSSEQVRNVCLERASPISFEISSSCDTVLSFEFSLYTTMEKRTC